MYSHIPLYVCMYRYTHIHRGVYMELTMTSFSCCYLILITSIHKVKFVFFLLFASIFGIDSRALHMIGNPFTFKKYHQPKFTILGCII